MTRMHWPRPLLWTLVGWLWLLCFELCACTSYEARRVLIPAGKFVPFYLARSAASELEAKFLDGNEVAVKGFYIDEAPVTYAQFAAFLKENSAWSRGQIGRLLADENYLIDWVAGDFAPEKRLSPIVNVSWFAAAAYCSWRDGRLPNVVEWEYVAAASPTNPNATRDPDFLAQILAWYGQHSNDGVLSKVRERTPNYYGVFDMHGLVWEWTADFNSVLLSGDDRKSGEALKDMFCGAGALTGEDRGNYAAFIRYAYRNSLQGPFTTQHLGFRCVYDQ